jgi:hypothetical protein
LKILLLLLSLLIFFLGLALVIRPRDSAQLLIDQADNRLMQVLAVGVRLVLGGALILYASESRFPHILEILGWIALLAGVVLAFVPPSRFARLIRWAFDLLGGYMRLAGLAALAFAAFLIYAVI